MSDSTSTQPFRKDDGVSRSADNAPVAKTLEARGAVAIGAQSVGAVAVGALAIGALALGAVAIGAFSIGRLSVRRVVVQDAHLRRLRIDHLTIGTLQRPPDEP